MTYQELRALYFDIKPGEVRYIDAKEKAVLWVIHSRYKFINLEIKKEDQNYAVRIKTGQV